MGIEDFKGGVDNEPGVKNRIDKLNDPEVCPSCGEKAEIIEDLWYDRCNNPDCDTITFIRSDYKIDSSLITS